MFNAKTTKKMKTDRSSPSPNLFNQQFSTPFNDDDPYGMNGIQTSFSMQSLIKNEKSEFQTIKTPLQLSNQIEHAEHDARFDTPKFFSKKNRKTFYVEGAKRKTSVPDLLTEYTNMEDDVSILIMFIILFLLLKDKMVSLYHVRSDCF